MLVAALAICSSTRVVYRDSGDLVGSGAVFGKRSNAKQDQFLEKGRIRSKISIRKKVGSGSRSVFGKRSNLKQDQFLEKGRM